MGDNVDDVFSSEMLHEDFSGSGVITAFESFIGQLKKLFLVMCSLLTWSLCGIFPYYVKLPLYHQGS